MKINYICCMKRILISCILVILFACSAEQEHFRISVEIRGNHPALKQGEAYLNTLSRYHSLSDTVIIRNGKFVFKGSINTPGNATIRIKGLNDFILFYLENDTYEVTAQADSVNRADIIGGETHQMMSRLDEFIRMGATQQQADSMKRALAQENPLSSFALELLVEEAKVMTETLPVKEKWDAFVAEPKFRNNAQLKVIENLIAEKKFLDPGHPVHIFNMNNHEGIPVDIAKVFRENKLTMLYFWAADNDRSRSVNQSLKELYNRFSPMGLAIIGVSLDDIHSRWVHAIDEDRLPWIQISDLQGTFTPIIPYYEINTLPMNVLVDQEGKIVKRKVPFEELEALLGSLLP